MTKITRLTVAGLMVFLGIYALATAAVPISMPASRTLRSPADFQKIGNTKARSLALYAEMSRVIESTRCLNCHPADRHATQGNDMHPHVPPLYAGVEGHGSNGVTCGACHGAANVRTYGTNIQSVPGDPRWALAPAEFAWQHRTAGEICRQIRDPKRNGHRTLPQIHEHMATDHLVGWAWRPGAGRTSAPGTQAEFGRLVQGWIDTGSECPSG